MLERFATKEEKSWIMSVVPFDQILKESDEEDEAIYKYRLTEK